MTTTETINGQPIKIKWEFKEAMDFLTHSVCNYRVIGQSANGNKYKATVMADAKEPKFYKFTKVENIEEM